MTVDEDLLQAVDKVVQRLGTTRSSFTREALRAAFRKYQVAEWERRHHEGYKRKPVKPGEFDIWEKEQVWVAP